MVNVGLALGVSLTLAPKNLEVIRSRSHLWVKVLWSIWLAPYAAAVIYGWVVAISYVPRLLAI